jgi:hypothetical protein
MRTGEQLSSLESSINDAFSANIIPSQTVSTDAIKIKTEDSKVSLKQVGFYVSAECLVNSNIDCGTHLVERVNEMRSNLATIGKPTSLRSYISLHDIVTWYTGSGFGSHFDDALENYFSYVECNAVGSEFDRGFQIRNGMGKLVESGVCNREQHMACGTSLSMLSVSIMENSNNIDDLVQKVEGEICEELTYSCDPDSNFQAWEEGKNKIIDSFGNYHLCERREACSEQNISVHNKRDLCERTWIATSLLDNPQAMERCVDSSAHITGNQPRHCSSINARNRLHLHCATFNPIRAGGNLLCCFPELHRGTFRTTPYRARTVREDISPTNANARANPNSSWLAERWCNRN